MWFLSICHHMVYRFVFWMLMIMMNAQLISKQTLAFTCLYLQCIYLEVRTMSGKACILQCYGTLDVAIPQIQTEFSTIEEAEIKSFYMQRIVCTDTSIYWDYDFSIGLISLDLCLIRYPIVTALNKYSDWSW